MSYVHNQSSAFPNKTYQFSLRHAICALNTGCKEINSPSLCELTSQVLEEIEMIQNINIGMSDTISTSGDLVLSDVRKMCPKSFLRVLRFSSTMRNGNT